MYVRNYGMPPKSIKKDDNGAGIGISTPPTATSPSSAEGNITVPSANAVTETDTLPPSERDFAESEQTPENGGVAETSKFGANGLPRQPLRRRKLPTNAQSRGKSCENNSYPSATTVSEPPNLIAPSAEPIMPFISSCDEQKRCEGEQAQRETAACADSSADSCISPSDNRCRNTESRGKNRIFDNFSTEELLLGGLILLLINDRASDDILLILAFLLVSGTGEHKKQ